MKATEITAEIINGTWTEDELKSFYDAYNFSAKLGRAKLSALLKSSLKVGDKGTIQNIRPKSLVGKKVEVTRINKSNIEIKELDDISAFPFPYTIPTTCFKPE